jgi:hypothetical protein
MSTPYIGADFTPDIERRVRRALRDAHDTDLVNEAARVIGREKYELRNRLTGWGQRDALVDSVVAHYAGHGSTYGWGRTQLLDRLERAANRRNRKLALVSA